MELKEVKKAAATWYKGLKGYSRNEIKDNSRYLISYWDEWLQHNASKIGKLTVKEKKMKKEEKKNAENKKRVKRDEEEEKKDEEEEKKDEEEVKEENEDGEEQEGNNDLRNEYGAFLSNLEVNNSINEKI